MTNRFAKGGKVSSVLEALRKDPDFEKGPKLREKILSSLAEGDKKTAGELLHELKALLATTDEGVKGIMAREMQRRRFADRRKPSREKKAEGGEVEEDDDRPKLSLMQAVGRSLAGAIPFTGENEHRLGEDIGAKLERLATLPVAGGMTQWWGNNPNTGELEYAGPGSGDAPPYPDEMLLRIDPEEYQRQFQAWREYHATPQPTGTIPGIIDETAAIPLLGELMTGGKLKAPEFSQVAGDRIMETEGAVLDKLGLTEPEGLLENILYSGGIMAGQVPVPAAWLGRARKVGQAGKGMLSKIGGAGLEFVSPIIDPKMKNYVAGTLFGGTMMEGMGQYGDYTQAEIEEELAKNTELADLLDRHHAGDTEATAILTKMVDDDDQREQRLQEMMENIGRSGVF